VFPDLEECPIGVVPPARLLCRATGQVRFVRLTASRKY
jgi:hypothetical protein